MRAVLCVAVLLLAVSGRAGEPTVYVLDEPGVKIALAVPAPANSPLVRRAEQLRIEAGAAPASYVLAMVDNSTGPDRIAIVAVKIATLGGAHSEVRNAAYLLTEWDASLRVSNPDLAQQIGLFGYEMFEAGRISPGGQSFVLLATSQPLPADIKDIFVQSPSTGKSVAMTRLERNP